MDTTNSSEQQPDPAIKSVSTVVRLISRVAQRYLKQKNDDETVQLGQVLQEKLLEFKTGELSLRDVHQMLFERDRLPGEVSDRTESAVQGYLELVADGQFFDDFPSTPQKHVHSAEIVEENTTEEQTEQNISDSFADVELVPYEEGEGPPRAVLADLPEERGIPECTFDDLANIQFTKCSELHKYPMKYLNLTGQVISVFSTQKSLIIRFWDGNMLSFSKLTTLKLFLAEQTMMTQVVSPAIPELENVPSDYYLDIVVYGEWIDIAQKLQSGDIIGICNVHMALPKQHRVITAVMHEGNSHGRNIHLLSRDDAASDQMHRDLILTARHLKDNNSNDVGIALLPARPNVADIAAPIPQPRMTSQKSSAGIDRHSRDLDRPGPSIAAATTARANSPTPPPPFRTAKQILERPVSPVVPPVPVVVKSPVKKISPPSSTSGPSTSSAQPTGRTGKSRVTVVFEDDLPPSPKKTTSVKKPVTNRLPSDHWSKHTTEENIKELNDIFAKYLVPLPPVKRTFPVAADDDDHHAENTVPYERNVIIRRPYGETKNIAVQTENPLVRSAVVQTDVHKTKSSSVQTMKSPVKKQRSVQTVAEIKPTTSSLAIQTDAVEAPAVSASTSGKATGPNVPMVQNTASTAEPPRTRSKSIKTELLSPPSSEILQPAPPPIKAPTPPPRGESLGRRPLRQSSSSAQQKGSKRPAEPAPVDPSHIAKKSREDSSSHREATREIVPPTRSSSSKKSNASVGSTNSGTSVPRVQPKHHETGDVKPFQNTNEPVIMAPQVPSRVFAEPTRRSPRTKPPPAKEEKPLKAPQEEKPFAYKNNAATADNGNRGGNQRQKGAAVSSQICKRPQVKFFSAKRND